MRARAAIAGSVGALLALGVGELVSVLLRGVASPVDAVGQLVVRVLPPGIVNLAIATLGTANRPTLAVGTLLVVACLGALAGALWIGAAWRGLAAFAVFGALGLLALAAQPDAPLVPAVVTIVLALLAGCTAVWWAVSTLRAAPMQSEPSALPIGTPTDPDVDRRAFLRVALGGGALALGAGALGRGPLRAGSVTAQDRGALPAVRRPLPAVAPTQDLSQALPRLTPVLTPNESFFRIDTAIALPVVDVASWTLTISGLVEDELTLGLDDLLSEELVEVDATIACVSNEVGGNLIGTARWTGVLLADLLERAGVRPDAEQVLGRSVDGFTAGFPRAVLDDGRPALVAVGMNGEPLPLEHGYPARLVVPGLYGYVSATKWLSEIELTPWEGVDGYWIPRGWSKLGPVKTSSRIDRPRGGADPGIATLAGVAWAPTRGIRTVEVSLDGGDFEAATLVPPLAITTWVQWYLDVELTPGSHVARVRAIDGDGRVQSEGPKRPAPDGAEGWHERPLFVN